MRTNQPIFLGGCERSGTTLLRVILDAHSNVHCGPEAKIIAKTIPAWVNQRKTNTKLLREYYRFTDERIDALYRNIILTAISRDHTTDTPWIAEKSPQNVFYYSYIRELFPQSPIINMVRDGRDVVASLLEMDWRNDQGKPLEFTVNIEAACERWLTAVNANASFQMSSVAAPYLQIRYEDLVSEPRAVITEVLALLGERWEDCLLDFHSVDRELGDESSATSVQNSISDNRIGRWKSTFKEQDKRLLNNTLETALQQLGYDTP